MWGPTLNPTERFLGCWRGLEVPGANLEESLLWVEYGPVLRGGPLMPGSGVTLEGS